MQTFSNLHRNAAAALYFTILCATNTPLHAQESTDMPAAVQPGLEVLMVRQTAMYERLDDTRPDGVGSVDALEFMTGFHYGLTRDVAVNVDLSVMAWDLDNPEVSPDDDNVGLDDIPMYFQWRFFKNDTAAVDTQRASLLVGAEVPSFDPNFSSDSVDPLLGVTFTQIRGRHGFNAAALWKFNTAGKDDFAIDFGDNGFDTLKLDASYLYRLAPEAYTADTQGSHYAQFQLLNRYETNGDTQAVFAPGYMYEGREWAFEATVHLPVTQDLDHRPELEWGFNVGVRFLF